MAKKSTHIEIDFSQIKANPYRDLKSLPLIEAKVIALEESIRETGFWDNVIVRKNDKGVYECAFGNHRIAAAKRAGLKSAFFIVRELTDAMMIAMMARENAEVYGNDIRSTLESVRATVSAYAAGKIGKELVPLKDTPGSAIRYAPSFVSGKKAPCGNFPQRPYTASTVARFLGYFDKRKEGKSANEPSAGVSVAFQLLELQERENFDIMSFLETKRRKDGVIPIFALEEALRGVLTKRVNNLERREEAAKKAAVDAEVAKAARLKAERDAKAAAEELERVTKAATEAAKADAPNRAKAEAARLAAKALNEKAQNEHVKAAKAAEKKTERVAEKTAEALEAARLAAEEKQQAQHESFASKLKDEIDSLLSPGHSLYEELKAWKRNPRTTDKQRSSMVAALYNLGGRVESFNVHVSKPQPRKGEK